MIVMYVLENCIYCVDAEKIIKKLGVPHKIIPITSMKQKEKYKELHEMNTFPQIFFKDSKGDIVKIGGYTELVKIIEFCKSF